MKTVTLVQFRQNAEVLLRRVAKGERFVLSYRGKPAARLEPLHAVRSANLESDPFLTIARRALPSPRRRTRLADIDQSLYGSP